MRYTMFLFFFGVASAFVQDDIAPQPKLVNLTHWGSACPEGGFNVTLGPVNATTNIAPLTFTLANFLPALGSFSSSLRMCDIVTYLAVDSGWKVKVNTHGTRAQGNTDLPGNATMFLRGSYVFQEKAEIQSIGMINVDGPLSGLFEKRITPVEGDEGIVGPCMGGTLDIEFQARAVEELFSRAPIRAAAVYTSWTLSTEVEIVRC